jgi:hypothetical protein
MELHTAIAHARAWLACNSAAPQVWVGQHSCRIYIDAAAAQAAGEPVIAVSAQPAAPAPKPKATTPKPKPNDD